MFVQFMLKNVLSFKEETVFDMTAINAYKEHPSNVIDYGGKEKFLKVAAIYGANASGKSNLHIAMAFFQNIIRESFNNIDDEKDAVLPRFFLPFSFEENYEPSEFQIVTILGNYEYKYGFEYDETRIITEWLYRKNLVNGRTSKIFERVETYVEFGPTVRKECEIYREQLPAETLVLSFFNRLKLKTDVFQTVYSGIMDTWVVPANFSDDTGFLEKFLVAIIDSEDEKEKLLSFLSAIDTGIKDITYERGNKDDNIRFFTYHKGKDGNYYLLNFYSESEGTIKSIVLFMYATVSIFRNKSIFVDELNIKLHPLLLKFILDLFYNSHSEVQLIYTTHDTTLMDKKFFRRDQIWFVQKDEFGYSELSALSDFKVRSDASFEKDYLAGVYGGIPLLKEFDMKKGE